MNKNNRLLLVSLGNELYKIGVDVEKERNNLQKLVNDGVPYTSHLMIQTLKKYNLAESKWKQLEKRYNKLLNL